MKYQVMIGILFTLLARRKVNAGELASRFGVSVRSIYRYVDEMTCAGIPVDVARGANGGIYISDTYKLPKGLMTREEYAAAIGAIRAMLAETGNEALRSAAEKLSAQIKSEVLDGAVSGNILVDSGTWGDEKKFSEKLMLVSHATESRTALTIEYVDRGGETTNRVVLPHLLVYKQSVWYLWGFCRLRENFRLFRIGRMRSIAETGEIFERIPFEQSDIPLSFRWDAEKRVRAKFSVTRETMPFAEDWLGVENVYERDGVYFAEAELPDDGALVGKILSAGAGLSVLEPKELAERVKKEAEKISASYLF